VSSKLEAHLVFFAFDEEALILLLFVSASANFSFASLAACRSYGSQPIFPPEEIFLLAHNSGLIVNPKGS
jgi:hypothetical protein